MKMEIDEKELEEILKNTFLNGIEVGKMLGRIEVLERDIEEIKKLKEEAKC